MFSIFLLLSCSWFSLGSYSSGPVLLHYRYPYFNLNPRATTGSPQVAQDSSPRQIFSFYVFCSLLAEENFLLMKNQCSYVSQIIRVLSLSMFPLFAPTMREQVPNLMSNYSDNTSAKKMLVSPFSGSNVHAELLLIALLYVLLLILSCLKSL